MSVYIPEFNSAEEFTLWFIDLFDTEYGTTSFFSSPQEAKNWVDDYLIRPNFSLSNEEVAILLFWSDESLAYANNWLWTSNNPSNEEAAVIYWNLIKEYIELYSYDPDMIAVVTQGASAAEDTFIEKYDEDVKTSIKIPIFVWIAVAFLVIYKTK